MKTARKNFPNKATQFKRGNEGGPGRPRTAKFAEACRQLASELGKDGKTGAQILAEFCLKKGLKGSARHLEMFLHYAEGRPATRSEEEVFPMEPQPIAPVDASKIENKTVTEIQDFREKLLRGEMLEIPPKPN